MDGNGALLIQAERSRQQAEESYSSEHDDKHKRGELIDAAVSYAAAGFGLAIDQDNFNETVKGVDQFNAFNRYIVTWPWSDESWKPSKHAIRNLVKAGALIAAEIDRLQRIEG